MMEGRREREGGGEAFGFHLNVKVVFIRKEGKGDHR